MIETPTEHLSSKWCLDTGKHASNPMWLDNRLFIYLPVWRYKKTSSIIYTPVKKSSAFRSKFDATPTLCFTCLKMFTFEAKTDQMDEKYDLQWKNDYPMKYA